MNNKTGNKKPPEAIWTPLTDLPPGAENWTVPGYEDLNNRLQTNLNIITNRNKDKTQLNQWLKETARSFAIETGQIEGLYTLKRGVTEQLIAEGLHHVRGAHTIENLNDNTIQSLLEDQENALEMIFDDIKDNKPLTNYTIKSWHQLLTRHQETVTGLLVTPDRKIKRVQRPFTRKGQYKIQPNNPKRGDGIVHEYCPPEHVQSEMDRFLELYAHIRQRKLPTHVEAGWLHHRFVRTHPFQDGNGRVSRQLVAYAYLKRREACPVLPAAAKHLYIEALENADKGNLKAFCDYLGDLATTQTRAHLRITEKILRGDARRTHGNGGVTKNGKYYPPENSIAKQNEKGGWDDYDI